MTGMVERVAKEIDGVISDQPTPEGIRRIARAAVAAMRKPTKEMLNAGGIDICRAGNDETNSEYELFDREVAQVWTKMIDAALKEE